MSAPPDHATARRHRLQQAALLVETRRIDDAIDLIGRLVADEPDDVDALVLMTRATIAARRFDEALWWSENALAAAPDDARALACRAALMLELGDDTEAACADARRAVEARPGQPDLLLVLVRAQLANGDTERAAATAASIRRLAPGSSRGPLAEALVELARADRIDRPRLGGAAVWLTLVTGGAFLLAYGPWWVVRVVRRSPHLRRADQLIHEALRLDPDDARLHLEAADVQARRWRFGRSTGHEIGAAALDGNSVDADRFAAATAMRIAGAAAVGYLVWLVLASVLSFVPPTGTGHAALGGVMALLVSGGVALFEHRQLRALPPRLRTDVRRRLAPLVVRLGTACLLVVQANAAGVEASAVDEGSGAGPMYGGALVVWTVATVVSSVRTVLARRRPRAVPPVRRNPAESGQVSVAGPSQLTTAHRSSQAREDRTMYTTTSCNTRIGGDTETREEPASEIRNRDDDVEEYTLEIVDVGRRTAGDVIDALPEPLLSRLDPFSVIDIIGPEFIGPTTLEVPEQPVAGITLLTYVVRGTLEHVDSHGGRAVVEAGEMFTNSSPEPGLVQQQRLRGDDEGIVHVIRLGFRSAAHSAVAPDSWHGVPWSHDDERVRTSYLAGWDYIPDYGPWWPYENRGGTVLACGVLLRQLGAGCSMDGYSLTPWRRPESIVVVAEGSVVVGGRVLHAGSAIVLSSRNRDLVLTAPNGALLLDLEGSSVGPRPAAAFGLVMDDEEALDQAWQDYLTCRMGWIE